MSWEDQGRQEHGWFGNGTAPPKLTGQDAPERLDLDTASSTDVAAVRAYLWAKAHGPTLFGLPRSGAVLDKFADTVMQLERARPGRLAQVLVEGGAAQDGNAALMPAAQPRSQVEIPTEKDHSPQIADGSEYSPSREGYHHYQAGPNVVCSAAMRCTPEEIADQMSRFAVPGQLPDHPVQSGQIYAVRDPTFGRFIGYVRTRVSADGLTTQNTTRPGHLLYKGQITRTATQSPDGSWSVTTIGVGNNAHFSSAIADESTAAANEMLGPHIFDKLDEQMRRNIEQHRGGK